MLEIDMSKKIRNVSIPVIRTLNLVVASSDQQFIFNITQYHRTVFNQIQNS